MLLLTHFPKVLGNCTNILDVPCNNKKIDKLFSVNMISSHSDLLILIYTNKLTQTYKLVFFYLYLLYTAKIYIAHSLQTK